MMDWAASLGYALAGAITNEGWDFDRISREVTRTIHDAVTERETQLKAWHQTFGTSQLSHAIGRLETAERRVESLQAQLDVEQKIVGAIALALDGLPITGEKTGPRSAKYPDFPDQIKRLRTRLAHARSTLKFIASKSHCPCRRVPGLGGDLSAKWVGCPVYHSKDSNEWCFPCMANAALARLKKEGK